MIDKLKYTENCSSQFQILNHLERGNLLFQPPLDSYINIAEYSQKLFSKAFRLEVFNHSELIGLVAIYFSGNKAFISNFSIEKEWIGKGFSKQLMEKVITETNNKKIKSISLEVFKENERAISFYAKYGFVLEKEKASSLTLVKRL